MKGNQFYLWLYILYWIVSSIAIYYYTGAAAPRTPPAVSFTNVACGCPA